jgi:serine/threonine-protein kinase RsbT
MKQNEARQAERQIRIASDVDIVEARQAARLMAAELGFEGADLVIIATAVSEVARNIVEYAKPGEVWIAPAANGFRKGLQVVAIDRGPGIPDVSQAMEDGFSSGRGLGIGLPGSRRLMDDFEIDSKVGRGTKITMRKWLHATK